MSFVVMRSYDRCLYKKEVFGRRSGPLETVMWRLELAHPKPGRCHPRAPRGGSRALSEPWRGLEHTLSQHFRGTTAGGHHDGRSLSSASVREHICIARRHLVLRWRWQPQDTSAASVGRTPRSRARSQREWKQNWAPKGGHDLILGTWEYVRRCGRGIQLV